MLLDHKNHIIVMDTTAPKFKLDFLEVGGVVKAKFTDLGGKIKLIRDKGGVYILLLNCPEDVWEQIANEVKVWCSLKHRIYLEEKRRRAR